MNRTRLPGTGESFACRSCQSDLNIFRSDNNSFPAASTWSKDELDRRAIARDFNGNALHSG
jgi:hypothetical protein